MFWSHRHTLIAAATHLHDTGLVNYLRSLIWSIQESCIRLQGQSEPLDSIGLHYSWETQRGTRQEGGREKREGARHREQTTKASGSCFMCIKTFPFSVLMNILQALKPRWDHSICRGESGGEGLGGNTAAVATVVCLWVTGSQVWKLNCTVCVCKVWIKK